MRITLAMFAVGLASAAVSAETAKVAGGRSYPQLRAVIERMKIQSYDKLMNYSMTVFIFNN